MSTNKYPSNTLAFYLLHLYGIDDDSAMIQLSPQQIKIMEYNAKMSRTPKAFRSPAKRKKKNNKYNL